ncbi:MAG: TrlF family AAA-like ATPase [Planctomycetota bacterium]
MPMDNGAVFYRCDFQIHTPRDQRWHGDQPTDPADRVGYATDFIQRCREKGVDAIGITDHHDMCMVKYIQMAAQDDAFEPGEANELRPADQVPLVFPGVELTLGVPCQAIVLLDVACGPDDHRLLCDRICGGQHDENTPEGPEVQRLTHLDSLEDVDDALGQCALKGRYIILPNVSDGGSDSLLRNGQHGEYARMPCVGGYVDGGLEGHAKQHILDGQVVEYGRRALGVFQTSDYRGDQSDRDIGEFSTWVKIAAPTAEALRQACLARQSRISQRDPKLPDRYISRLRVSDSLFMGQVDLRFNRQFNALIGGRGTGKSTLLEYLRFAMRDQPVVPDEEDLPPDGGDIERKRRQLISTLVEAKGTVEVGWIVNGVSHEVRFDSSTEELTLAIGDSPPEELTPGELRRQLPIQAYSQKQLSTVGTTKDELLRLIKQPIQRELQERREEISEQRERLTNLYSRARKYRSTRRDIRATKLEITSVQQQAEQLEKTLEEVPDGLLDAIDEHPLRLKEREVVRQSRGDLARMGESLSKTVRHFDEISRATDVEAIKEWPQGETVARICKEVKALACNVKDELEKIDSTLGVGISEILEVVAEWEKHHEQYEEQYSEAVRETEEHRDKLEAIQKLRSREAELHERLNALQSEEDGLREAESQFHSGWDQWLRVHRQRADLLEEACNRLDEKSDGEIEVELQRAAGLQRALDRLRSALEGCRIRQNRWDDLKDFLGNGDIAENWKDFVLDLRTYAELTEDDFGSETAPPEMEQWALTEGMRSRMAQKLTPEAWLEVALVTLEDEPTFYYKTQDGNRIGFNEASAGQQATALLKVLLHENEGPLIIDQPEEDLDNEIVGEITKALWEAKKDRQMIFTSHNANIVVNGDAELVAHCCYRQKDGRIMGCVDPTGAIDVAEVREAITNVMEGGEEAFKLRKEKYGF